MSIFRRFVNFHLRKSSDENTVKFDGHKIGIGCAITTRNIANTTMLGTRQPFFIRLLPTFCDTASPGYNYTFYVAYDYNDHILVTPTGRAEFLKLFDSVIKSHCEKDIPVYRQLLMCNHTKQPARAQNDALMAAYHANMDYLYMVNDDTHMMTTYWTEQLINQLAQFHPPNVGLVGPVYREGNKHDLTYNFVHRTHVDIFKCFYPPMFKDWYADSWISRVYKPNNVVKVPTVRISHTMEMGTRYNHSRELRKWLDPLIVRYQQLYLRTYLEKRGIDWREWVKEAHKTKSKMFVRKGNTRRQTRKR